MKLRFLGIIAISTLLCCCNNTPVNKDVVTIIHKDSIKVKRDTAAMVKPKADDTPLPPEKYNAKDGAYDSIGFELLDSERLGQLMVGLPKAKVLELLGKPDQKSETTMSQVDGIMYQSWTYTGKGITLTMDMIHNKIGEMIIVSPCPYRTKRRIGIGSTEAEVKRAYEKAISYDYDNLIIAGSEYGGIQFTIQDKKVIQIYFGASAE
ncbi:MAG TPA: hypothetical protein VNY36_07070 [Bacteroidia bacterium]|jgi:hypothetical protein|nr:hypothetical protein [Bacteroidia bacterium]